MKTEGEIVHHILHRNEEETIKFLYQQCYPLFKSVYNKYYTGYETCVEFINQIYLLIMPPRKSIGVSLLQTFGFLKN